MSTRAKRNNDKDTNVAGKSSDIVENVVTKYVNSSGNEDNDGNKNTIYGCNQIITLISYQYHPRCRT